MGSPRNEPASVNSCDGCEWEKDPGRWDNESRLPCDTCTRVQVFQDNFEPAEPVVLSAEEMVREARKHRDFRDVLSDGALIHLVKECRKNYRLERDLEVRGLVEPLNEAFKYDGHNCRISPEQCERLSDAHRNLKPLNKD